jgi:transcriptional regulator with XRE-family HTH domain
LTAPEQKLLRKAINAEIAASAGERIRILTRAEFVEQLFYDSGYAVGAQIVGFNLPFDLSRLAIRHTSARRSMRGGFILTLSDKEGRPAVAVKHLSQRAAMIRFTGMRQETEKAEAEDIDPNAPHESEEKEGPDRGYFVDVKTLAAALTSGSHSLESLSALLKVPTPKQPSEEHGGPLTADYIRYALRDVQTTWECFDVLAQRFATFGLEETGPYDLYSEASLGKAYLRTMNIKPWRQVQPEFPPKLIGQILSSYYGGRAEVYIRRQIVPVIHCDFLSMYPTVCTLMGLWEFVRAMGISHSDDTEAVSKLVETPRETLVERLRHKDGWRDLTALVQVLPNRDLFPVRAQYPDSETITVGLNHLSAREPLWFTLADMLASKILTGRTPKVLCAIRFQAMGKQEGLKPLAVAGEMIDPATDDFYQRLIIHRNTLKRKLKTASEAEKPILESDQKSIKILANATSYGIFVELNVEEYVAAKQMIGYGVRPQAFKFKSKKFEKPGRYFHPLLGTLITGAARLMLALAEHQVTEQKLDWAFCDTDSIAIANTHNLPLAEFKATALKVRDWFKDLNPYGEDRSILQLEDVNFPEDRPGDLEVLDPPYCLAVSAKRYALFNCREGLLVIRKASGHGLGHLLAPYDETPAERRARIERIGVPLWQEDLWKEIIRAAETDTPDQTKFMDMPGFDAPAASQYAATTPELLAWFEGYNDCHPEGEKIFPFGFLLSLQAKSRLEMAQDDPEGLSHELWRRREPRPAAPYFKRAIDAQDHAFDRDRGDKIPASWLKSHGRSLVRYHLHPETKFWGGEYDQRGLLRHRHVFALAHMPIGKESDQIEENEYIGEEVGPLKDPLVAKDRAELVAFIAEVKKLRRISDRVLLDRAGVSAHTLRKLRKGGRLSDKSLFQLVRAAEQLRQETESVAAVNARSVQQLREFLSVVGSQNKLAKLLGVSRPYLGRVLRGEKPITAGVFQRLRTIRT